MYTIQIPDGLIEKIRDSALKAKINTVGYLFLNLKTQKVMGFYQMYVGEIVETDVTKETLVSVIKREHNFELVGYHTKYSKGELTSVRECKIPDYKHVYISPNIIAPLTRSLAVMTFVPEMEELMSMNDLEKELLDLEERLEVRSHQAGS